MKTTEIFVEQVLIGLLVLATGALPYLKGFQLEISLGDIGKGAGIIALAYLLGIVFDRFADTIVQRFEQYNRLKFAVELKRNSHENKSSETDPYPEDVLRAKILGKDGETSGWMEYLRSRIRLSRSLAVFTPALTLSGLLATRSEGVPSHVPPIILGVMALTYVLSFIMVKVVSKHEKWKLPKTGEEGVETAVKNFSWKREPTTAAVTLLAFVAAILVALLALEEPRSLFKTLPILLIGCGISTLSAWSWWRITHTFMKFLITCEQAGIFEKDTQRDRE